MIKIFQTGDLHLDSPFSGGDIVRSEKGRKRLREVFRRMMKYVRENGYDLLLIPGDLYENGYLTEESAEMLKSEFASLSCPVVISPGNHDPYEKGSFYACADLPENVHIFKSDRTEKIDFDPLGVSVYGYAFHGINHRENPLEGVYTDGEKINILCAHTEVNVPLSSYAPMSYSDMEAAGFDYAALAHIHKAPEVYSSRELTAAYSGFAEGRAFDEIGKGGALSVSVFETGEHAEIKIEKLDFSEYSFEILPLNIGGLTSDEEVAESIISEISSMGYGEKNAVRISLEGLLGLGFRPNIPWLIRKCDSAVDLLEIKDNSLPLADADELERDMTLRGEFYRTLKEKINSADIKERSLAATALRIGLAALENRDLSVFLPAEENTDIESEAN
ncbi:MAG: metallophosphoesterase [Clostridia bacterium]|nr:metallophosphoesterase [Clostridia bacterium]